MAFLSRRSLIATGLSFATAGGVGYALWPRMDGVREEVDRQRRLLSADPGLEELVRMATLAPNGHNTQPWRFQLGERTVAILPDVRRRTPVVDPDDHHLFVSLGCATENLVIAAAALGHGSEVVIGAGAEPPIEIALTPARPGRQELYEAIPLRQSTRSLYDGQPVSTGDLALLEAAAREDRVSVRLLTGRAERAALLDFVVAANSAQMDDPAFVEELTGWIRFSPASALETGDGLFAPCSGSPALPDWLGHRLFPRVFRKAAENDKHRDQIRSSAGLAVFVAEQADPAHWIRVGRSFERFALQAAVLGIRTAHVNQPVEVPALRTEFARWLGTPGARPDLVVRFGRAPAMPMSLRRPVSAVLA
ncbi:Tat pathway signal protein [Cereibacter changlensis JA139]|uniref:Tat pathway signal protein n=2 Tax=Cereibacter changlensis TaxID=402884 RepID=A0A2T4JV33_9RHOB|nr:Tat pathway signal protein [Cereibacter changlensis]PTE21623.1 Tat pathway signal protein [Cereibacter changlensis JA139]PZX56140.1 hypothetical protein LX76_01169 [Cereibacter changlensis]